MLKEKKRKVNVVSKQKRENKESQLATDYESE